MNRILCLRVNTRLLTLLLATLTCICTAAQPTLTIREDMPISDIRVKQITYGNGIWLAVLMDPVRLYKSPDGIRWSKITAPPLGSDTGITDYEQRPSLAYGAGQFVLASDSGRIFSSPDLVTWTRSITGTTRNIIAVKYLNSTFYAVGDTATFLSSPDGVNWTAQHTGIGDTTGSYQDIFYGNGHLVIAAYNHEFDSLQKQVLYENTAGVWTGDSSRQYYGHGFAKDHFYEFATDSTSISEDLQHWSAISFDPAAGMSSDVFDDTVHVYLLSNNYVSVNNSPTERAFVSSSDDGVHFGSPSQTSVYGGGGAYFNHRYFIWGGLSSSPMAGSADGLHYVIEGSDTAMLSTDGTGYVRLNTTPDGVHLYHSPDFTQWTPGDTLTGVASLTYDTTRFWAVGTRTNTSTDGLHWTGNTPSAHAFTGITYAGGRYIAWSRNATHTGPDSLWYSPDGVGWTQATTPIDPGSGPKDPPHIIDYGNIVRVRFLKDTIFAVSNAGLILHSSDGITYSLDYGGNTLGPYLTDVAYDADSGKYYFLGLSSNNIANVSLTTASLANPFVLNPGFSYAMDTINGLAAGTVLVGLKPYPFLNSNGRFVSMVDDQQFPPYPNSHLLWSTDGVHWDSHTLDRETQITDGIAKGDSFRIEGTHNYEIIASFSGSPGTLPVTLLDFNARLQQNSTVLLTWKTTTEQNSRAFTIQRSTGSNTTKWDSIGSVTATGNSNTERDYSFTDANPATGFNSYRLRLTNLDNSSQTSEIKRVYLGSPNNITFYPNPVRDYLTIQSTLQEKSNLTLYDATGQEILQQTFTGSALTLPFGNRAPGLYYLVLKTPDGTLRQYPIVHVN